jgi:hypothetical protein
VSEARKSGLRYQTSTEQNNSQNTENAKNTATKIENRKTKTFSAACESRALTLRAFPARGANVMKEATVGFVISQVSEARPGAPKLSGFEGI